MTHEKAWKIMCNCAMATLDGIKKSKETKMGYNLFTEPQSPKEIEEYFGSVYHLYKDLIEEGSAEGVGYLLNIDRIHDCHPIYVYITLYLLLVANANIYILYDGSYCDYEPERWSANRFIDAFLETYDKAKKIVVSEEMTYKKSVVIEWFIRSHLDIKHLVYVGDFINFHPNENILKKLGINAHFPAAHYVIVNYTNEIIPIRDRQLLSSFGRKCFNAEIDYAAYTADDNKHSPRYGFDIDVMYTDLVYFNTLKNFKDNVDKIVTVIFTDKSKTELNYPEEFYELFDVYFSSEFNDNIINYDFGQLFL